MCATTGSLLFNFCFFLFLDPTVGATPFHGGGYPFPRWGLPLSTVGVTSAMGVTSAVGSTP